MPRIWIAELMISDRTALKIATKHGLSADEVKAAVEKVVGLRFSWDYDLVRGERAILKVRIKGHKRLVVLYPDRAGRDGVWHLGSAYEDN